MQTSLSLVNIASALAKVQLSVIPAVQKDSINSQFDSGFASLGKCISAVRTALSENGIVLIQSPSGGADAAGYVSLTTRLMHSSGEWIEDTVCAPATYLDAPGYGSVITYLRRYALLSFFGLYQDDDDDAQSAASRDLQPPTAVSQKTVVKAEAASGDVITPDIRRRMTAWEKSISGLTADRAEQAESTIKNQFSGKAQTEMLALLKKKVESFGHEQ